MNSPPQSIAEQPQSQSATWVFRDRRLFLIKNSIPTEIGYILAIIRFLLSALSGADLSFAGTDE
jgi:hypothetical protein